MDKCRICLANRKSLQSVFELDNDNLSLSFMIFSISNIKISKDDRDQSICRMCRKKLKDAYEFKVLIVKSDAVLCEANHMKKVNFNNIDDIKIKVEIETDIKPLFKGCDNVIKYFEGGVDEFCYIDTIIKKVEALDDEKIYHPQPMPVLDFLKSIKDEPDDNDNYDMLDYYSGSDESYTPPYNIQKEMGTKGYQKRKTINKSKVNKSKSKKKEKQICIKPIVLKDLKPIPSKAEKSTVRKPRRPQEKIEICPHCGKISKSLKQHLLQHTGERKYSCGNCGKAFFTKNDLERHMRKHDNVKQFKCEQCVAAFYSAELLRSHMLRHSDIRKHVCSVCSKGFKRLGAKRRHEMAHNSANKNKMCELCNMSFFTNSGLKHHMRVHTGERPFNCEICSQPYSYKHDFNRHCLKKHGIFLKRRSVYVMNEEVLKQEKILMRNLMLRVDGTIQEDQLLNHFDGPQGSLAYEYAMKAIKSRQIPVDL